MPEINSQTEKITSRILRCESWIVEMPLNRSTNNHLLLYSGLAFLRCGKNAVRSRATLC